MATNKNSITQALTIRHLEDQLEASQAALREAYSLLLEKDIAATLPDGTRVLTLFLDPLMAERYESVLTA